MTDQLIIRHLGYEIIAAEIHGNPVAQVYTGKSMATPKRFGGTTREEACEAAKAWINQTRRVEISGRRAPHVGNIEEYTSFLEARLDSITTKQQQALAAHARAASRTLTPTQIAEKAGWADFHATNLQYGGLGKEIADALQLDLPKDQQGNPIATYALADSADPEWKLKDGHFRWQMH